MAKVMTQAVAIAMVFGCNFMDQMDGDAERADPPVDPEMCLHRAGTDPMPPKSIHDTIWPCSSGQRQVNAPAGEVKVECLVDGDVEKVEWSIEIDAHRAELIGYGWQWSYIYEESIRRHKLAYGVQFGIDGEEVGCICVWPEECPAGCDPC